MELAGAFSTPVALVEDSAFAVVFEDGAVALVFLTLMCLTLTYLHHFECSTLSVRLEVERNCFRLG